MINDVLFDTSGAADASESCLGERSTRKRRGSDGLRSARMVSATGVRERTRSAVVAVHLAERVPSIPSYRPSSMSCRERPLKFHRTTVPRPNATPPGLQPLYPPTSFTTSGTQPGFRGCSVERATTDFSTIRLAWNAEHARVWDRDTKCLLHSRRSPPRLR
jgi:hypothetical protein